MTHLILSPLKKIAINNIDTVTFNNSHCTLLSKFIRTLFIEIISLRSDTDPLEENSKQITANAQCTTSKSRVTKEKIGKKF